MLSEWDRGFWQPHSYKKVVDKGSLSFPPSSDSSRCKVTIKMRAANFPRETNWGISGPIVAKNCGILLGYLKSFLGVYQGIEVAKSAREILGKPTCDELPLLRSGGRVSISVFFGRQQVKCALRYLSAQWAIRCRHPRHTSAYAR